LSHPETIFRFIFFPLGGTKYSIFLSFLEVVVAERHEPKQQGSSDMRGVCRYPEQNGQMEALGLHVT
jgi:hypothetical protein